MARYGKREDPLKDAIGVVCFVLAAIAFVIALVFGLDKGFAFLSWVSQKVVNFVMLDLSLSP